MEMQGLIYHDICTSTMQYNAICSVINTTHVEDEG